MDKILLKIKRKGYSLGVNYLDNLGRWHGWISPPAETYHVYGRGPMAVAKKLLKLMEEVEVEVDKPISCKMGNAHLIHDKVITK